MRRFLGAFIAAIALAGAAPGAALAASAAPGQASVLNTENQGCTYGSSGGNVQTCFDIVRSGLNVSYMSASASVVSSGRTLAVGVSGPSASAASGYSFVGVHHSISASVPNLPRTMTAGKYCGTTYRKNANGSITQIGQVCFSI